MSWVSALPPPMWIGLAARVNSKKGSCAMTQTREARDATVIE
jgi:hypothetical protein